MSSILFKRTRPWCKMPLLEYKKIWRRCKLYTKLNFRIYTNNIVRIFTLFSMRYNIDQFRGLSINRPSSKRVSLNQLDKMNKDEFHMHLVTKRQATPGVWTHTHVTQTCQQQIRLTHFHLCKELRIYRLWTNFTPLLRRLCKLNFQTL